MGRKRHPGMSDPVKRTAEVVVQKARGQAIEERINEIEAGFIAMESRYNILAKENRFIKSELKKLHRLVGELVK